MGKRRRSHDVKLSSSRGGGDPKQEGWWPIKKPQKGKGNHEKSEGKVKEVRRESSLLARRKEDWVNVFVKQSRKRGKAT